MFFYWILELFRQCSIFLDFSISIFCLLDFRTLPTLVSIGFWFRQCGIFCFSIRFWNSSDSVVYFVFLLDFGTLPTVVYFVFLLDFRTLLTVWYILFFYWILELIRQCGIFCFSIRFWNSSDSVVYFVFLLDFGTIPTVWYILFL